MALFQTRGSSSDASSLSKNERATLSAVCDAFFPGIDGAPGALSLSVPQRIEETLPSIARRERDGLRLLLRLLGRRLVMLLLCGRPVSFTALSQVRREQVLRKMSLSLMPALRSGFQGLFRLSAFHC